jgi:pathogenesis-related protein 1
VVQNGNYFKNTKQLYMQTFLMASLVFCCLNTKAQTIPANTGSNFKASEAKIFLDHHNKVRAEVGVGKLTWSSSLSNYAQSWANQLADKKCKMKHSECRDETGRVLGENIFWGSSSAVYGTLDASKSWYEEKADYNGERIGETRGKKVGHYTQMVWKYTREVGAGVAYCPSGAIIVVASYHPAGNIVGSVPY